jgi:hypothetical protein
VTNTGTTATTSWTVTMTFANGQTVSQVWGGTANSSGSTVTVTNASYNGAIATNAATTFGLIGS